VVNWKRRGSYAGVALEDAAGLLGLIGLYDVAVTTSSVLAECATLARRPGLLDHCIVASRRQVRRRQHIHGSLPSASVLTTDVQCNGPRLLRTDWSRVRLMEEYPIALL